MREKSKVLSTVEPEPPVEIDETPEEEVVQGNRSYKATQGVSLESEDVNKWEMETEPLLDKIYHKLLGEVETIDGTWKRDKRVNRVMNELGASEFVQEIRSRFNINMQLSDLSEIDVRRISAKASKSFSSKLVDNVIDGNTWEVKTSETNFDSICRQLFDAIYIFLNIARNGGMKYHRERRGIKTFYNPGMSEGAF